VKILLDFAFDPTLIKMPVMDFYSFPHSFQSSSSSNNFENFMTINHFLQGLLFLERFRDLHFHLVPATPANPKGGLSRSIKRNLLPCLITAPTE
jgi:hypothetical protein